MQVSESWAAANGTQPIGDVTQQARAVQLGRQAVMQAQRELHVTQLQVCLTHPLSQPLLHAHVVHALAAPGQRHITLMFTCWCVPHSALH